MNVKYNIEKSLEGIEISRGNCSSLKGISIVPGLCRADKKNPLEKRDITWYDANVLAPMIKEGKINDRYWYDYANGKIKNLPIYVPDGLMLEELEKFQSDLYRTFYLNYGYILKRLKISFTSIGQFREDIFTAYELFKKGRTTTRSHKEEDYF